MKKILALGFVLFVLVIALTYYATKSLVLSGDDNSDKSKPLYWVAPMDPNYRRDQPGKSPMGMDLIPVYRDEGELTPSNANTVVKISAAVINTLGVRTEAAQFMPLDERITTVGYIQYDEDRLVHIHPRVDGWVDKLYVSSAGDPVTRGEPLYELYSPELVNAQEELLLALNRDNQRLVQAAEDRLRALQIDARSIAQLRHKRRVQQTMTFYAPQTGVVDTLNIREGFYVKPGTTIMSIGALDQVWLEAEVYERHVAKMTEGLSVTMHLDYLPGRVWRGQLSYVYPSIDEITRTARLRIRFDNPEGLLKPNMFAQISIDIGAADQVLAVPRQAVIRTGRQDRVVLALGDGRFTSVAVVLGRYGSDLVEVLSGIEPGDTVVTSAQFLLDSESNKGAELSRLDSRGGDNGMAESHRHHSMDSHSEPKMTKQEPQQ